MTDLSQRIMDAWLAVNPEPFDNKGEEWWSTWRKLKTQLTCGAYESAVIQFLMPHGWIVIMAGEDRYSTRWLYCLLGPLGVRVRGRGDTPAEALLNAIIASKDDFHMNPIVWGVSIESGDAGPC